MNKQTRRMVGGWAVEALLLMVVTFGIGCGEPYSVAPDGDSQAGAAGTGGDIGYGGKSGMGGASGQGGTSVGGSSGEGGTSSGGSSGTGGQSGQGGNPNGGSGGDVDAGGAGGSPEAGMGGASGQGGTSVGGSSGTGGQSGQGGSSGDAGVGGSAGDACVPIMPGCPTIDYCGAFDTTDNCGNSVSVDCGGCLDGFSCQNHACVCTPVILACNGACGTITGPDGCGGTTTKNCGVCGKGTTCSNNQCVDIDECTVSNPCSPYADCTNTWGSYTCACWPGYNGSGVVCTYDKSWTCNGWARDASFDALKISGNDIMLTGGMWGTSGTDYYATVGTYTQGAVAHRKNGTWYLETLNPAPSLVYGMWGAGPDDIWVGGYQRLFHWNGSAWTEDPNKPSAWGYLDFWYDGTRFYMIGEDMSYQPKVWRREAGQWVAMTTPTFPGSTGYRRVWGLNQNHVFITGANDSDMDGHLDKGLFFHYDGNTWTNIQVPSDCTELVGVSGTSMKDLYVVGQTANGGVIYHVTDDLQGWAPYYEPQLGGYGPVLSMYPGTVLAAGSFGNVGGAGLLRLTTDDQPSDPTTYAVDNKAYGAVQFWAEPGTDIVHFVHISYPGTVSGHYTGTCN